MPPAPDDAIARFREQVPALSPPALAFAEGSVLLAAGRPAEAAGRFAAAAGDALHPLHLKMLHGLGQCWFALGRLDEAESVFVDILTQTDALLDPIVWLARTWMARGRHAEAFDLLRRALARHRDHPHVAFVYADGAVALHALGRVEEGLAWCREAVEERGIDEPALKANLAAFRWMMERR